MGTYTTNYGLLKAGDGTIDPVDDYVDVISQLDRNLSIIDNVAKRAINYALYESSAQDTLPTVGNFEGDKLISNYDHSAQVWNGTQWVQSNARGAVWTDITPNSGYETAASQNNPGYTVENNVALLRGGVIKTGLAIWAQGVNNVVFPAGRLPTPITGGRSFIAVGGISTSRLAQYYYIVIPSDGSLSIIKFGNNAQTASNTQNFVTLDGISYGVS